jgi:hypothetical protein
MGLSYDATTIVGLRIHRSKLIKRVLKSKVLSNCSCSNNNSTLNFCPDCGKKNNLTKTESTLEINKNIVITGNLKMGDFVYLDGCKMGDFTLFTEEESEWIYVPLYKGDVSDCQDFLFCPYTLEDLIQKREKMIELFSDILTLEEFQQFFGVYTLLRCN